MLNGSASDSLWRDLSGGICEKHKEDNHVKWETDSSDSENRADTAKTESSTCKCQTALWNKMKTTDKKI